MTIRLAIIGAGIMGADHARIFAEEIPGVALQVICDASPDRARSAAEATGALHTATDAETVIARTDVDAVVIASPDFTHAALTRRCIALRKPVLCEKPLSQSSAECLPIMADEQAAGRRFVQVGFMRRFDRSYAEMKRSLDEGRLGRALMMHNFHRNVSTPSAEFTGAMAITNSAPHEFDVARHILGTEYAAISATQPKRSDALVAPVVMVLETTGGQVVTVEVNNNAAYGFDVRAELVGERASVTATPVAYTRTDAGLSGATAYDTDWRGRYAEAYRRQNRAFVRFAETGAFPAIAANAWDGYAAAVVAEAGVRALAEGRREHLTMSARPEFYA